MDPMTSSLTSPSMTSSLDGTYVDGGEIPTYTYTPYFNTRVSTHNLGLRVCVMYTVLGIDRTPSNSSCVDPS